MSYLAFKEQEYRMRKPNLPSSDRIQVFIVAAFWIGFCVAIYVFGDGGLRNKQAAKELNSKIAVQNLISK